MYGVRSACTLRNNAMMGPAFAPGPTIGTRRGGRQRCAAVTCTAAPGPRLGKVSVKNSEAAKQSAALVAWLEANGTYLSPVATWGKPKHPLAIANETTDDGEYSGRGCVAVKGIVQGEPLFEVPLSVIMSKERALELVPCLPEETDEYIAIAILLIQERARGTDSFWKAYIDVLPRDEELVPLFRWNEADLELLKGSPCVTAGISLRSKLSVEFHAIDDTVFCKDRARFPADVFDIAAWEWAFAVLFSRAIMLTKEQRIALVPYADLLNHNPFCSTYIDVQKTTLTGDRFVTLYTDRPYSRMDQVYVTYGPKSNADLLLLYGFVVDRNPYDSVEINVSLGEGDPQYERKAQYLRESGVETTSAFPLYRDRYPMELIEFLRFCMADEKEMEADFGGFINERNETAVAQSLIMACKAAIAGYPQTIEDDDKLLKDRSMYQIFDAKQRWAIRQRRAEKRILQRTIATIEQELSEPTFMFSESGE